MGETKPLTVVVILTLMVRIMVVVEGHLDQGHRWSRLDVVERVNWESR